MATKTKTADAPAEETQADAVAPVEVSAGPQDGAEAAAPVAAAEVTEADETAASPLDVAAEIEALADAAAPVEPAADPVAEATQEGDPALTEIIIHRAPPIETEDQAQPVHVPSLLRIWVHQIETRNEGWLRGQLIEDLREAGMEMPIYIERGVEATISLGGVTVTSHMGEEFILNYWAAQARQALLGSAA